MRKPLVKFTCRLGGYCDITGTPQARPIVYLVPLAFFLEDVKGKLPAGVRTEDISDWTGDHHAVKTCSSGGKTWLETGNQVTYTTYNPDR